MDLVVSRATFTMISKLVAPNTVLVPVSSENKLGTAATSARNIAPKNVILDKILAR